MSRRPTTARASERSPVGNHRTLHSILVIAMAALLSGLCAGCDELDGRNRTRQGNRMFRETRFIDAVAEYEQALKTVEDPIIHYNLGLAYSKVFKPGVDKPLRLGIKDTFVCDAIPNTKIVSASVCVKDGERRYDDCDAKTVCASSYECKQVDLCTLEGPQLADAAATHFQAWLKANPIDYEMQQKLENEIKRLQKKKDEAKTEKAQLEVESQLNKKKDELENLNKDHDDTRKQMTQVWIDSGQFKLAVDYWKSLLDKRPNDGEVMGNLAGINLKSGDWRTSIEWYIKVANAAADTANKVAAYQFIGNVAWSKLNSKSLTAPEVLELADKGIGALQRAAQLAPKNPKLFGLQASIYNFRALAHGASWAAALDRASAQDLQRISRVLAEQAKKAQGAAMPLPTHPSPTTGGPAEKAGG